MGCFYLLFVAAVSVGIANGQDRSFLLPPYLTISQGHDIKIKSNATCGEDAAGKSFAELYCKIAGANPEEEYDRLKGTLIQGQLCDICQAANVSKGHPASAAIDGTERWWQSPPLSRGNKFEKVTLDIDLGQEFHIAYIFIRMANSPRPARWILQRSKDFGKTYQDWQYFAETHQDCQNFFRTQANQRLTSDDTVVCTTQYSKLIPLEGGEVIIPLIKYRPSARNFSRSVLLQEWTTATNIRMKFLKTKTLLGHLMRIRQNDPTVTRRYYYSIRDIEISGTCVCNGHADVCYRPRNSERLKCNCSHNTCGDQCGECCPGFVAKKWRKSSHGDPFQCERCQCFGHSDQCVYNETVAEQKKSLDVNGKYEGGGVCQNCRDFTKGVNCHLCEETYFRPTSQAKTEPCRTCGCYDRFHSGSCVPDVNDPYGRRCLCKEKYVGTNCDECAPGFHTWPECYPCECDPTGSEPGQCKPVGGGCVCKPGYAGERCDQCADGHFAFPDCKPCDCNPLGSEHAYCDKRTGNCICRGENFAGRDCSSCATSYFDFPTCRACAYCNVHGVKATVCDKTNGRCECKGNFTGDQCNKCNPGYYGAPAECVPCECAPTGSISPYCYENGQCACKEKFGGDKCDRCAGDRYGFPECKDCDCHLIGSVNASCDGAGRCFCRRSYTDLKCDKCIPNRYNFPRCEECICDPAGSRKIPGYPIGGCGSMEVAAGKLCVCKENVAGHNCETCKRGHYGLDQNNLKGCENCDCHEPGVISGLMLCNPKSGQCVCKPYSTTRRCKDCIDGTYNLAGFNLLGCQDCECDVGGSRSYICAKSDGQCPCRTGIKGFKCDRPKDEFYYPELHHIKFEVEEGETLFGRKAAFNFDQSVFPAYSWRGYAIFNERQPALKIPVAVLSEGLYQPVIRYKADNDFKGSLSLVDRITGNVEATFDYTLAASAVPKMFIFSGASQLFNFRKKEYDLVLSAEGAFVDWVSFIPNEYYEASVLQKRILKPCRLPFTAEPCVHFGYPPLMNFPKVDVSGGYYQLANKSFAASQTYDNANISRTLGSLEDRTINMALLDGKQQSLITTVPAKGFNASTKFYAIVTYRSEEALTLQRSRITMHEGDDDRQQASLLYNECPYSWQCRTIAINKDGLPFEFSRKGSEYIQVKLEIEDNQRVAIERVTLVPVPNFSVGMVNVSKVCVMVRGVCVAVTWTVAGQRIEFENYSPTAPTPTEITDPTMQLIFLNSTRNSVGVSVTGEPNRRVILAVHYYQPFTAGFTANVTIEPCPNCPVVEGVVHFAYCPDTTGCRALVMFGYDRDSRAVDLIRDTNKIIVKTPEGKTIYLDYVLVLPERDAGTVGDIVTPPSLDVSSQFIETCMQNLKKLNRDMIDSLPKFCKKSVFSMTVSYNREGALACACDPSGAENNKCDSYGGQCKCKNDRIIGRTCRKCREGHYQFPDCIRCQCPPDQLCDVFTGDCICPESTTGKNCDSCIDGHWGFHPVTGCDPCDCVGEGSLSTACNQTTGQCECRPNVMGRKCDQCKPGYYNYPECAKCDCEPKGSPVEICNNRTGECLCKENVGGTKCDQCEPGTFGMRLDYLKGCTRCYCSGLTTQCKQSDLKWETVSKMTNWTLLMGENFTIDEYHESVQIELTETGWYDVDFTNMVYFLAPREYLGDKTTAYGGYLSFDIFIDNTAHPDAPPLITADVILVGRGGDKIYLFFDHVPLNKRITSYNISLVETSFGSGSKHKLMRILSDLREIRIRATYYMNSDFVKISNVKMTYGTEEGDGGQAIMVEQCDCPDNTRGPSCQLCVNGYYHYPADSFQCAPCQCNEHTDLCELSTGKCIACRDNTTGDHCEKCLEGYYRNERGECIMCPCPEDNLRKNFATGCDYDPRTRQFTCYCRKGYKGDKCNECAPGYFGDLSKPNGKCRPCMCNGNILETDPKSCDSLTGICNLCLYNTSGDNCAKCKDWFYGDAIIEKNCQPCACDKCGSEVCDHRTGDCFCRDNVIGDACDKCAADHFGLSKFNCTGCQACQCHPTSADGTLCDVETGMCTCKDKTVGGRKCDKCTEGHYDFDGLSCKPCPCSALGTKTCTNDGKCICKEGHLGEKCDQCDLGWLEVPNTGCLECDQCVQLLLEDLKTLEDNMTSKGAALDYQASLSRLAMMNKTLHVEIIPSYNLMVDKPLDITDVQKQVDQEEANVSSLKNKVSVAQGKYDVFKMKTDDLKTNYTALSQDVERTDIYVDETLNHLRMMLEKLKSKVSDIGIDEFLKQAEKAVEEIRAIGNFTSEKEMAESELAAAKELLIRVEEMKTEIEQFKKIVTKAKMMKENLSEKLKDFEKIVLKIKTDLMVLDFGLKDSTRNLKEARTKITILEQWKLYFEKEMMMANNSLIETNQLIEKAIMAYTDIRIELNGMIDIFIAFHNGTTMNKNEYEELLLLLDQARLHQQNLTRQAASLKKLLVNVTISSDRAVKAANAFKSIADNIEEAEKLANDALANSTTAKTKSGEMKTETTTLLNKAKALVAIAKSAYGNISDGLSSQLENVSHITDEIEAKNIDIEKSLKEIDEGLSSIDLETVTKELTEANQIIDKVDEQHKETEEQTMDIIPDGLKKLQEDADKITVDKGIELDGIRRWLEQAQIDLDMVNEERPKTEKKVTELVTLKNKVMTNMRQLREAIQTGRSHIEKISVAMNFTSSQSYAVLREHVPMDKHDPERTDFEFWFRAKKGVTRDQLLLYYGPNVTNMYRYRSSSFDLGSFAILLRDQHLSARYDLGDGPVELTLRNATVVDGLWHKIRVNRYLFDITFTLWTAKQKGSEAIPLLITEQKLSPPPDQRTGNPLLRRNAYTLLLLGGVDSYTRLPSDLPTSYSGCMYYLRFYSREERHKIDLWDLKAANKLDGCGRAVLKEKGEEPSAVYMRGAGDYVVKKVNFLKTPLSITMSFKTFQSDVLLAYLHPTNNSKDTYMTLQLIDGSVKFEVAANGKKKSYPVYAKRMNDGEVHTFKAVRISFSRSYRITIDDEPGLSNPYDASIIEMPMELFVAGIPPGVTPVTPLKPSLRGCIIDFFAKDANEFRFGQSVPSFRPDGIYQPYCPAKVTTISFSKLRQGYFYNDSVSVGPGTSIQFRIRADKSDQNKRLIAYMVNEEDDTSWALFLEAGVFKLEWPELTDESIQSNTSMVYDTRKEYHLEIRISDDSKWSLVLDYSDRSETKLIEEQWKNQKLYIGGLPLEVVPSFAYEKFDGCISYLQLNGNLIDFKAGTWAEAIPEFCHLGANATGNATTVGNHVKPVTRVTPSPPVFTTKQPFTVPPTVCAIPDRVPSDEMPDFRCYGGNKGESHSSYNFVDNDVRMKIRRTYTIVLRFRTARPDGIMMYVTDARQADYVAVYMYDGRLYHAFNAGGGPRVMITKQRYNDSEFHELELYREIKDGQLISWIKVDKHEDASLLDAAFNINNIDIKQPVYLGGMPAELQSKSVVFKQTLDEAPSGFDMPNFVGCLGEVLVNSKKWLVLSESLGADMCYKDADMGVYFPAGGAVAQVHKAFYIGTSMTIRFRLKSYREKGVILSVGNKGDFLHLYMYQKKMVVSVNNGAGVFNATYTPKVDNEFCNGQWHSIVVVKAGHAVSLEVDGVRNVGSRPGAQRVANTNEPLFVGGIAEDTNPKHLPLDTRFHGCIAGLKYSGNPKTKPFRYLNIAGYEIEGTEVKIGGCPTAISYL